MGTAALAYATELGWAVFPLKPGEKIPLVERGCLEATTNPEQIAAWWDKWPNANIGVATGGTSKVVVVDVDGADGETALADYGVLPHTPVSLTGKGRHLFFAAPLGGMRNSAKKLGPQLDTRGDGGYVVVPPSVHPDGHRYQWDRENRPSRQLLPDVPARILERLRALDAPSPNGAPSRAAMITVQTEIGNGTRDDTLAALAGRLLAKGHGEIETLTLLRGVNATKCAPPLPDADLERIVRSIGNAERRRGRSWSGVTREDDTPTEPTPIALTRIDQTALAQLAASNVAAIDAVPTMFSDWNDACRGDGGGIGVACGWNVTVAGATGAGKSLVALNFAAAVLRAGRSVTYVTYEMSSQQLTSRFLSIYSGHNVRELEKGRLYSESAFVRARDELLEQCAERGAYLYIAERPSNEIADLAAMMRQSIDEHGSRVFVIDYVQKVHARGAGQKFDEQMRRVSDGIQRVAYDNAAVTVVLSQYNRATSFNKDAPPTVQGMIGSSALENDSDQSLLLDHTGRKRVGNRSESKILLAKNRHGPEVDIPVVWDYTTLRVTQMAPDPMDRTEHRHGL